MKSNFLAYIISFTLLDLLHPALAQTVVGIEWDTVPLADPTSGGCEIDADDEEQFCYSKIKTVVGAEVSFTEGGSASIQTYQITGNVDATTGEEIDEESWFSENCAEAEKLLVTGGTLTLSKKGGNYFALGTDCSKLHKVIAKPKKIRFDKPKKGTVCDGVVLPTAIKGGCPKKCRKTTGCVGMQITRGKNRYCTLFSEVTSEENTGDKKQVCRLVRVAGGAAAPKSPPLAVPDTPGKPDDTPAAIPEGTADVDGESESEDGESISEESVEDIDGESASEDGESISEDGESEESVDGESESEDGE
ncbi:predicted protein [Chaetoceros tenuissimus]|uniref:Uncharacterized protein n=1 Tax=Chaetoceros tenuissimus TaxID=426638 RepID=A0AAD3CX18_9STRA|nr:predicted protein [Chaetoceros tenuissimus]